MSSESNSAEPLAPSLEDLAPLFPAYEFEGFIAQGGMGAVYKARQKSLDRPVAIKILPRELGEDPVFRASFEAEARAMARLNHPNLVGVYDFGEADGMLFIVMEYVHGNSLHRSCHGKAIDPAQAGEIVSAISRGLAHAHENGILHRDIKPGNILIDANARPKIGDFGLAFPMGEQADPEAAIYGTPGYAAPEVYRKDPCGPRSDIYSVGVLLAELLTGSEPAEREIPSPPSRSCGCPRGFDAIVARATQANPQLRYPDAGALADDLDKAVDTAASGAGAGDRLIMTPPPTVLRTATPSPIGSLAPTRGVPAAPKRSLALPVSLGAIAVAIGFFAVMAGSGERNERPPKTPTVAEVDPATLVQPDEAEPADPDLAAEIFAGSGEQEEPDGVEPGTGDTPTVSPLESLAKLKGKLASGERDEFPVGAEVRGDAHFLLVDQALTWGAARRFAEEHGAHLAVFSVPSDRQWFRDNFKPEGPIWIGGGLAGRERWQWLDGSRWLPIDTPAGVLENQRYLTLSSAATLSPASAGERFQFAIQWRADGENPATLGAELRRVTESINSVGVDAASFPIGTRSYEPEGSHFFAITKTMSWDDARQLALAANGYLAVPSSVAENDWIRASFSKTSSPDTPGRMWIGGYRLKPRAPWQWLTREAWNSSAWLVEPDADDPTIKTLLLGIADEAASSGWIASSGAEGDALGLLVEWSKPKKPAAIASFDLDTWLADVDRKYIARIKPDVERYEKERGEEIESYVKAMRREAGKLESRLEGLGIGGGRRGGMVDGLIDDSMEQVEETGELPDEFPRFIPGEFREIQASTKRSLDKIDQEYEEKISVHMESYTGGLVKQATALGESGFEQAASALNERVGSIDNSTDKFLGALGLAEPAGGDPGE